MNYVHIWQRSGSDFCAAWWRSELTEWFLVVTTTDAATAMSIIIL